MKSGNSVWSTETSNPALSWWIQISMPSSEISAWPGLWTMSWAHKQSSWLAPWATSPQNVWPPARPAGNPMCTALALSPLRSYVEEGQLSQGARAEPSKTRLVEWVWSLYGKGQLLEAVDKGLSMEFDQRQMECLMTVGLWSCQWTRGCLWLEAVYKVLSMEFDQRQMECLMTVGLWCCHADSTHRPSTRQVINVLSFEAPPPNLPMTMPVPMYFAPPMHMCKFSYTSSATPTDSQWHQSGCSCNTCTSDSSMSLGSSKALLKLPKPDVWYLIVFQL